VAERVLGQGRAALAPRGVSVRRDAAAPSYAGCLPALRLRSSPHSRVPARSSRAWAEGAVGSAPPLLHTDVLWQRARGRPSARRTLSLAAFPALL